MIRLCSSSSASARRSVAYNLFAVLLAATTLPAHAQTDDEAARAAERARAEALEGRRS